MVQPAFSILMVCTANICRSPAAQSVLTAKLADYAVRIESAGTRGLEGNPVDATMARILSERGWDELPHHRSRALMPTMLGRYDLVLCMQDEHVEQTLALNPAARGKVRLLGHWSAEQVGDPIGRADSVYSDAIDQIEKCAARWGQKLIDMGMIK